MKTLETKLSSYVRALRCDRCKREEDCESPEFFEFLSFASTGGYDPVFGDGTAIELDLCQYCVKETLGTWVRTSGPAPTQGGCKRTPAQDDVYRQILDAAKANRGSGHKRRVDCP